MDYGKYIEKAMEQLTKGAFLTTKKDGKVNTMTIGWGSFGFIWGMSTFEALVRESRFSKSAMDDCDTFTVTIPYNDDMKEALGVCGRVSGRDADKIRDCGLEIVDAKAVDTPVVYGKGLVLECKTVMRLPMDKNTVDKAVLDKWYANGDLHTMYYGKIEAVYELD